MIDKAKTNNLIQKVDEFISKYSYKFMSTKGTFDSKTGNVAFLYNERTVAPVATICALAAIMDFGYKVSTVVNEFSIEFKKSLSATVFDIVRGMTSLKTRTTQWKRCFVDGYIQVKDILAPNHTTHVFIEYKMQNDFVPLDLATDYLKYKTYTYKSNEDTAFVYVIFRKEELYPGILCSSAPYYEILEDDISGGVKHTDRRVFIYYPHSTNNTRHKQDPSEALSKISFLSNLTEKVAEQINDSEKEVSQDELVYIKTMKKFNSNVLRSSTLKHYYPFIKKVWDAANNMNLFNDLPEIFDLDRSELTIEKIIEEGANYKENLSSNITVDTKIEAAKKGTTASTKTSLFLVSICDYFNEKYSCGVEPPIYYSQEIRGGKNSKTHNWQDTVDYFKEQFEKNYSGYDDCERRLKKIFYSTMFYIVNLFQIIYKIDDDNKISDYSDRYSSFRLVDILQTEINKVTRYFKYKDEIRAEDLLYNNIHGEKNVLMEFLNTLLKLY